MIIRGSEWSADSPKDRLSYCTNCLAPAIFLYYCSSLLNILLFDGYSAYSWLSVRSVLDFVRPSSVGFGCMAVSAVEGGSNAPSEPIESSPGSGGE